VVDILEKEALEKRREYYRSYYAKNKDKYKKANMKYWQERSKHEWHEENKTERSDKEL
jgi:hypothetical protein